MDNCKQKAKSMLKPYMSVAKVPNSFELSKLEELYKQLQSTESINSKSIGAINFWVEFLTNKLYSLSAITEFEEFEKTSVELGNYRQVIKNLRGANETILKLMKQTSSVMNRVNSKKTSGGSK